jgi:peroxiredoxin
MLPAIEASPPRRLAGMTWLLVSALLAAVVSCSANADEQAVAALVKQLQLVGYRAGTRPPQFSGLTPDARAISTTDLEGKVVLVNFWASWCNECRPEMPALQRLHRDLASRGLSVIGINAGENGATIRRYARELGLTFPLVLDRHGDINALYGVVALPATFIIGRDGRAVAFVVGSREWTSTPARVLIDTLLAESALRP